MRAAGESKAVDTNSFDADVVALTGESKTSFPIAKCASHRFAGYPVRKY